MDIHLEVLDRALSGERAAMREIVDALTPVIQARVARMLLRLRPRSKPCNVRQEVADMTQGVFLALFERNARILRSWDPNRGSSLRNFVGLVAERHVFSRLRSAKTCPWTEEPVPPESLEGAAEQELPEAKVASRELCAAIADRLIPELTPLGLQVFHMLFIEHRELADVCRELRMSADAVYAWRSRLGRRARGIARELMSETEGMARIPQGGRR